MLAKTRFEEAQRRAAERDAAKAAQLSRSNSRLMPESVQPSSQVEAAQVEMTRRECLCHPGEGRPVDSRGCCKATIDSARWNHGRAPLDVSDELRPKIEALIADVPRALSKTELRAKHDTQTPSQTMRDVVESISGKVPVIKPVSALPEGVDFTDANQARHLGKCILLRGMNFSLGAKDAYPLLNPYEVGLVADGTQRDQNIRLAIEEAASARGLGKASPLPRSKIFRSLVPIRDAIFDPLRVSYCSIWLYCGLDGLLGRRN